MQVLCSMYSILFCIDCRWTELGLNRALFVPFIIAVLRITCTLCVGSLNPVIRARFLYASFWLAMHAGVWPDLTATSQSLTPAWVLLRTDGPLAQEVQVVPVLFILCNPDDDGHDLPPTVLPRDLPLLRSTPRKHGGRVPNLQSTHPWFMTDPQRRGYATLLGSSIQSQSKWRLLVEPSFDTHWSTR